MKRIAVWHLAVTLAAGPTVAAAQTLGAPTAPGGAELPRWLMRWNPVRLTADLPRELPGVATSLPSLLTLPAPRVGTFWTAANPAGLPADVYDEYAQFRLGVRQNDGSYRRPLDAGKDRRIGGTGFGWKDLAANGAAIGRVVVERMDQDAGAHADVVLPHSSNPFAVLDTIGDAMSGMIVRLEGAGGWRIGGLGLGLGLGYDGRDIRTEASTAPRNYQVSAAGVSGGVSYDLFDGALQLGTHGRWGQIVQRTSVVSYAAPTRVYVLSGYYDPVPLDLDRQGYYRRFERNATAFGGSVGGTLLGAKWTLFAQRDKLSEKQSVQIEDDPPTDNWDADGWSGGLAAQSAFADSTVLVTLSAEYAKVSGEALRMDLEEVNFSAEEDGWYVAGEVRWLPRNGWSAAVRLGTGRESRVRQDYLARTASDLKAWAPAASIEVARALPAGFSLSVGLGYSQHAPWGSIPDPAIMGEGYQDWIAPELSLYSADASSITGTLVILWQAKPGLSFWAQGRAASLSGDAGTARLPLTPEGKRKLGAIEVGVTMR
jgi:hypothetical protein